VYLNGNELEIVFTNVDSYDNKLICTDENNKTYKYEMIRRKAHKGDIVRIINVKTKGDVIPPFNEAHKNKFYKVTADEKPEYVDYIGHHISVGNWFLYDYQYIVLEELI
jgi:hypothetical protein